MTLAHGADRLESDRLVLRRVTPGDLPLFTHIHALPEVAQHQYPGGRPRSPEETAAWMTNTLASYEKLALGYLAGRHQAPADVALIFECELGYTFDPAAWGQGFATEAAAILPQNARSRRVAERGGARADGQMYVVGLTWDRYVWPLAWTIDPVED